MKRFLIIALLVAGIIATGGIIRKQALGIWNLTGVAYDSYEFEDNIASTSVINDGTHSTIGVASANTNTLSTTGKIGDCFTFNGSSVYVNTQNSDQAIFRAPFSISVWIKPDDGQPAATNCVCGSIVSGQDVVIVNLDTAGVIRIIYYSDADTAEFRSASAIFADGATNWTHIVINFSETVIALYVNGQKITANGSYTGDMTGLVMADWTSTNNFYIGCVNNAGTPANYFDGLIDIYRLYPRCLSNAEIKGLYDSGRGTIATKGF